MTKSRQSIQTVVNSIVTNYSSSNVYDELLEKVAIFHCLDLEELKMKLNKKYKKVSKQNNVKGNILKKIF